MATIEQNLTSIAASLQVIVQLLQNQKHEVTASPAAPVVPTPAPPAPVAPPVVVAPVSSPVIPPAPVAPVSSPVIPPAPVAPPPVASGAPTTHGDLTKYVMQTYTELGPEKGGAIQGIISACGVSNINEINAAHFGYIFEQVERLKAA